MYFDSHAHYYDAKLEQIATQGVEDFLRTLFSQSVEGILNVGTDPTNSRIAITQALPHERMYAAVGIHPSDCAELDLLSAVDAIRTLAKEFPKKVVAIGEIGLDYYWEPYDKERQKSFLHAQLDLAEELSLPVVIHDREAHGDCFAAVTAHPNVRGVFHSYSGSLEMARELIRRGWYISFAGPLTFKNATRLAEVASALPHDRVLIETDCPYLTPHPHRGKINHSGYLEYTAAKLAELWQLTPEETASLTAQNARRLFGIS